MPESAAWSLEEGAGKQCLEFGGRCRKAMLGLWGRGPLDMMMMWGFMSSDVGLSS